MNNMQLSAFLIKELLKNGVEEFCLCTGARNASLIITLEKNKNIKTYHFFDERSAAFFALGRIHQTRKPVAVITTSGTAVAEVLPATIEAYYSGLPLIIITADRPKSYRQTGAPQAIEQIGIFSHYTKQNFDLDTNEFNIEKLDLSISVPIHINVCFDEPLVDAEAIFIDEIQFQKQELKSENYDQTDDSIEILNDFLSQFFPLVLIGGLNSSDRQSVLEFLSQCPYPIYVETISGLKNHPDLKNELLVPEKTAKLLLKERQCDAILRIGSIPTTRLWRDLESSFKETPVLSLTETGFSGLSRDSIVIQSIECLKSQRILNIFKNLKFNSQTVKEGNPWQEYDKKANFKLIELLDKYPKSEPGMVYQLSKHISQANLYLGNSMPIRQWDLVASTKNHLKDVLANRGANGIDGQLSTFLGWAKESDENWAIVGDLTALYDLSALWIENQIPVKNIKIVVINNHGGMIFNRMFKSEYFLNRHELDFSSWANMWEWSYVKWEQIPSGDMNISDRAVIELQPDSMQTTFFWQEWDKI